MFIDQNFGKRKNVTNQTTLMNFGRNYISNSQMITVPVIELRAYIGLKLDC